MARPMSTQETGPSLLALAKQESSDKCTLTFINLAKSGLGNQHVVIPAIEGLDLRTSMGAAVAKDGFIEESIIDYYHDVCVIGDAPVYESVFSMKDGDIGGVWLEPAWSDEEEDLFKQYIGANGQNEKAFKQACELYPMVFATYRIKAGFIERFAGTKYASAVISKAHPKIRPTLVTGYSQVEPGKTTRNWIPRPITIETYDTVLDEWKDLPKYDNLQVSQDGQFFYVSALRDAGPGMTWHGSPGQNVYDEGYLVKSDIRVTLAIEMDWRMAGFSKPGSDPNKTASRVAGGGDDKSGNRYTYTVLSEPGDYVEWLRLGSFPCGQIIPAKYRQFPDKATTGHELYTDKVDNETGRLPQHAQARLSDVRRIEGSGSFTFQRFDPGFLPGVAVKVENAGITPEGVIVRTTLTHSSNDMVCEMAAFAPGDITRGPSA